MDEDHALAGLDVEDDISKVRASDVREERAAQGARDESDESHGLTQAESVQDSSGCMPQARGLKADLSEAETSAAAGQHKELVILSSPLAG